MCRAGQINAALVEFPVDAFNQTEMPQKIDVGGASGIFIRNEAQDGLSNMSKLVTECPLLSTKWPFTRNLRRSVKNGE
jgi:hypothetical protein